jgi:dUTP pyrophosphatase
MAMIKGMGFVPDRLVHIEDDALNRPLVDDHVGLIRDRSGLALTGLTTRAGVIDPDYRGEIKVLVYNESPNVQQIRVGNRIAQLLILPCEQHQLEEADDLDTTVRGENGFGSTGI